MSHPKLPLFIGPPTIPIFTNWLLRCNHAFTRHPDPIPDSLKIELTGDAILQTSSTTDLHTWWITNSMSIIQSHTWESFQKALKRKVLGEKWEIEVFKDYFGVEQGDKSSGEFEEEVGRVVGLVGAVDSSEVKENMEKCLLVFKAREEVRDRILEEKVESYEAILEAKREDVVGWLRKYGGKEKVGKAGSVVPGKEDSLVPGKKLETDKKTERENPSPIPDSFPILYIVGQCSTKASTSIVPQRYFNDTVTLPNKPFPVREMEGFKLYACSPSGVHYFAAYEFFTTNKKHFHFDTKFTTTSEFSVTINFDHDEYITSYVVEYDTNKSTEPAIGNFCIKTSKGKTLSIKGSVGGTPDFEVKAPPGWAIVGLHGSYDDKDWGYPIRGIGPIFGRLSGDRTEVGV